MCERCDIESKDFSTADDFNIAAPIAAQHICCPDNSPERADHRHRASLPCPGKLTVNGRAGIYLEKEHRPIRDRSRRGAIGRIAVMPVFHQPGQAVAPHFELEKRWRRA
jgi:hypothetical protein